MGHVFQRMYGVVLGPTWLSLASHGKNSVPEVVPENEPSSCTSGPFPPDASKSGDPYDAACHGCGQVCDECVEPPLFPTCTDVIPHTASDGGPVTLEMLSIDKGYWRATSSSRQVLACYNADACVGGLTGTADYCLEGYEGPCKCPAFALDPT